LPLCYRHSAGAMTPRLAGGAMRRREFITLIGGAAAWPVAARAQQGGRGRRIGVLAPPASADPRFPERPGAFLQALGQLGWTDGRDVRIEARWAGADAEEIRRHAAELVALAPDVILSTTTLPTVALQRATRTIPIVFAMVLDPVGADIV